MVSTRSEAPSPHLTGRDGAVKVVETAVEALARGQGGCLVLKTAEGFGKSRLLGHTVDLAAERGVTVAQGAATPLDQLAPLSTLWTTLQTCCSTRLSLGQPGEALTSTLLIDRLGARLEELVKRGPLLVGIDDIHCADELTAMALRVLVPSLAHVPLLWVFTCNNPLGACGPVGDVLEPLFDGLARQVEFSDLPAKGRILRLGGQEMYCGANAVVETAGLPSGEVPDHLALSGDRSRESAVFKTSSNAGCGAGVGPRRDGRGDRQADPGVHTYPGERTDQPVIAWSDLTPAEMRVVRLVAQGMTNRQVASSLIVSPHTVDSHLRHSFVKLNVASRVQLTRLFFMFGEGANRAKS